MTRELVFKSGLTSPSLRRTHCYIGARSPHGLVSVICSPKRKCQMVFASPSAMPDSHQPSPSPFQAEPAASHPENPLWPSCSVGQRPGAGPGARQAPWKGASAHGAPPTVTSRVPTFWPAVLVLCWFCGGLEKEEVSLEECPFPRDGAHLPAVRASGEGLGLCLRCP